MNGTAERSKWAAPLHSDAGVQFVSDIFTCKPRVACQVLARPVVCHEARRDLCRGRRFAPACSSSGAAERSRSRSSSATSAWPLRRRDRGGRFGTPASSPADRAASRRPWKRDASRPAGGASLHRLPRLPVRRHPSLLPPHRGLHTQFQDFGVSAYQRLANTEGRIIILNTPFYSPIHCAGAAGFYEEVIGIHGASAPIVVTETTCRCAGDDRCTFGLRWS